MTTPEQQLQEETVKDLVERFHRGEYTIEQTARKAYLFGTRSGVEWTVTKFTEKTT